MKKTIFTFGCLFLILLCKAQWSGDPLINLPVCTEAYDQETHQVTGNGNGGAFLVWRDHRYESAAFKGDIYMQTINSEGSFKWAINGIPVVQTSIAEFNPKMVADGKGNYLVVWNNNPTSNPFSGYQIYAQRLTKDGTKLWGNNGVPVINTSGTHCFPSIAPDGSGGVFIAWNTTGNEYIYAQHLDANGNQLWNNAGLTISDITGSTFPQVCSDNNSNMYVSLGSPTGMYIQRINSAGQLKWGTSGISINSAGSISSLLTSSCFFATNENAFIVTGTFQPDTGIMVQKIDSSGNKKWTENGNFIAPGNTFNYEIIPDGNEGLFIGYINMDSEGEVVSYKNIFVQHINAEGEKVWATDVNVSNNTDKNLYPRIVSDGNGGILVTWIWTNDIDHLIKCQHVSASGSLLWDEKGITVSSGTLGKEYPSICTNGLGGAILTWENILADTYSDIYAQNINYYGQLGEIFNWCGAQPDVYIDPGGLYISAINIPDAPGFKNKAAATALKVKVIIDTLLTDDASNINIYLTHEGITDTLSYGGNQVSGSNLINTIFDSDINNLTLGGAKNNSGIVKPYTSLNCFSSTSYSGLWNLKVENISITSKAYLGTCYICYTVEEATSMHNNISKRKQKLVWPNPVSNVLHLDIDSTYCFSIDLFDNIGRLVKVIKNGICTGKEITINTEDLTPGRYYGIVKSKKNVYNFSFIKL